MRNTIITEINNIFDENVDLKIRNEYLESKFNKENICCEKVENKIELTELNKKIIEFGKDALRDKVITSASISVNKLENGDYYCTKFEDWAKDCISGYYMPDNFSKDELVNLFYDELKEKYNKKKADMIKEYEKSSKKEEE